MAELAHDASGPASSESAGIAQKVSEPASSDRGKLRVFISYSRDDLDFADQLDDALNTCDFECLIDRHGISGGEDWKRRLGNLISEADTVVFVLSPSSARSEICAWEVEEAARLNKRILPVNCRPLEGENPPPRLRDLNYVFFYKEPNVPGSGFGNGLAKLVAALNTDFDWLREHTRYLQRAIEWDKGGRPANRLLSGNDIGDAKAWVARRPKGAPEPTALQLDFIRTSEEEAQARLSEQRKQIQEMAAAQAERETALQEREEAQRKRAAMARIRNIALVAVSILAVLAGWLYWNAEQQRKVAEEQKEQTNRILQGATGIIVRSADKMDADTLKDSFTVFETGAALGDANSMNNLGTLYGVAKDSAKAREWFEKAADRGHPSAMWSLGHIYEKGQDYARAREWYEKAARGAPPAMVDLGLLYANGYGVAKDPAKAREWFEKAADWGYEPAMLRLGLLYYTSQDYAKAREWYEKAAEKGSVGAMTSLGLLYANGGGVVQDNVKAREWYEKAAEKGSGDAMSYLGAFFANGHGVPQDYDKARQWYEKAADKGNAEAMVKLGWLYDKGLGVPQDYAKAREWYEKAAAQGDADAKFALERLPIDEAETTGRYAEALQLQEALAAKVEAEETKRDGKLGEQTATEIRLVAWYALFAKEFTKALTVANRSHALFPDDLGIESNRAHALMFMERGEEAKALYFAHKGKPLPEADNQLWEQAVAEDFAKLREAGLTHPMMADIENALGISR